MTLPASTRRSPVYVGNGVATQFPFEFKVFEATDLLVVRTNADGTIDNLVLNSDYSVSLNSNQDDNPGGTITFPISGSPLASPASLVILGDLPYDQTLALPTGGNFPPTAIERAFDRASMQIQQINDKADASMRAPVGETMSALPPAASRANRTLGFDSSGNPTVLTPEPGSAAAVLTDLANTSSTALGDKLVGAKRTAAGAVATTWHDILERRAIGARTDFAVPADGATDARAALALADAAAVTAGCGLVLEAGTYRINSNITVTSPCAFQPGAVLRPASGVVVTLTIPPQAGVHRIFDLSLGGEVRIPRAVEVWADWWGAVADNATDCAAAFQAAHDALIAPAGNGNGGVVRLTAGTYLIGSDVQVRNRVVFRGSGRYTVIKATSGYTDSRMFDFSDGTSSQFNARLEELHLDGNDKVYSNGVVHARAWNEQCGLRNVLIENFRTKGVFVEQFYGGAATWELDNVEVFPSASTGAGTIGVHVSAPDAAGWFGGGIRHCVVAAPGAATNCVGIQIDGDVVVKLSLLHFEDVFSGLYLLDEANVTIDKLTGGAGVTRVIDIGSGWTGRLVGHGVRRGNASLLLFDRRAAGYTRFQSEDLPEPLIFPPDPGQILAAARCTGGATPVISGGNAWAKRISGVARNSVGNYRFTLSPSMGAAQVYSAWAISHETSFRAARTINQTATTFDVVFEDAAGAAAETTDFTVYVVHKP